MKKHLCLLFFLCSSPLFAQQREVTIRLFSNQGLVSVRITPRGAAAVDGVALKTATEIALVSGHLAIQGRSTTSPRIRITGSFVVETTGNAPVNLQDPLDVGPDGDRLRLIVTEPLEAYVAAALAGEASTFKSPESLKAMAVAIRTFAVRFGGRHRSEGFDFCDTTHCQDFRITAVSDRLRAAAEDTQGEILWFSGKPAATYYHQDCGGQTEDAGSLWPGTREPYLRAQHDSFCLAKGNTSWMAEMTADELRQATGATSVEIVSRTPTGRVHQLRLRGERMAVVSGEEFRLALGRTLGWNRVLSDDYNLQSDGRRFRFQGHGAGHGVGLCQAGAAQMGESGRSYRDILAFYYPGTKLGITAQGLTWTRAGGERVDLQTTRLEFDRRIITAADRLVRQVEDATGRRLESKPVIRVFPSVAIFRNSTGEPGWIAGSTRGSTIRLQPLEALAGSLEKTLHHELMHLLIEQYATPNLPRWFREGLTLALSDSVASPLPPVNRSPSEIDRALLHPASREQFFSAYADAKGLVAQFMGKYGRKTVLAWMETGLPPNLNLSHAANLPQR